MGRSSGSVSPSTRSQTTAGGGFIVGRRHRSISEEDGDDNDQELPSLTLGRVLSSTVEEDRNPVVVVPGDINFSRHLSYQGVFATGSDESMPPGSKPPDHRPRSSFQTNASLLATPMRGPVSHRRTPGKRTGGTRAGGSPGNSRIRPTWHSPTFLALGSNLSPPNLTPEGSVGLGPRNRAKR